jgi:hypothetical protein
MAGPQEVTIQIDDAFTQPVCDTCVGFLRIVTSGRGKSERALPCGTGTFVRAGNTYGILTAAHALKELGPNETVGLVRFPGVKPALQNFRLDLSHTERLVDWSGNEGEAPDVAFLKIPEIEARSLEALGAVFYNLDLDRTFVPSRPEHRMGKCYAVAGVVGEWTEETILPGGKYKKIDVGGLFAGAKTVREFDEARAKLLEAEIDNTGPRVPESYEGVSGGGLWELHAELDPALKVVDVKKKLCGVAFRQSDDRKRVTSNGSAHIQSLRAKIAAKWP